MLGFVLVTIEFVLVAVLGFVLVTVLGFVLVAVLGFVLVTCGFYLVAGLGFVFLAGSDLFELGSGRNVRGPGVEPGTFQRVPEKDIFSGQEFLCEGGVEPY